MNRPKCALCHPLRPNSSGRRECTAGLTDTRRPAGFVGTPLSERAHVAMSYLGRMLAGQRCRMLAGQSFTVIKADFLDPSLRLTITKPFP